MTGTDLARRYLGNEDAICEAEKQLRDAEAQVEKAVRVKQELIAELRKKVGANRRERVFTIGQRSVVVLWKERDVVDVFACECES